ncbi:MAG: ATP-binding protein, partial [Anaerolineae bacterium]
MKMQKANRVLIVEDDFLVGEKLRGMLEDEGYEVAGDAVSGKQAVEMTETLQPDVVVMDLNLPEMDGLTAARQITARHPTPIVALTAHESADLVAEASEAGIGYYLVKPATRREIARAISIAVARFDDLMKLRQLNTTLAETLAEAQRRENETRWLLTASRAITECHTFVEAARRIFDVAREATGAVSGYVALMSEDGAENEVLFLEAGGLPCKVDPELPMPIRGLRAQAYARKAVVYDNDFQRSEWVSFIPPNHVEMRNVLFAPLIIDHRAVGVLGLANKPTDFNEDDARIAEAFGHMVAIALRRMQAEEALRASQTLLKSTGQMAKVGGWELDAETLDVRWTEQTYRIHGMPLDYKPPMEKAIDFFHPDEREKLANAIQRALDEGQPYDMELRFITAHGEQRWVHTQCQPQVVEGKTRKLRGTIQDITERKEAQEKLAHYAADLRRSNEELEQFAHVISHDLREPARTVTSYLDLLARHYQGQLDESADTFIDYARDGARRMQEMINALLDLSRVERRGQEPTPTDVDKVLGRTLRSLSRSIEETEAEVTHDPLPTVMADEAQLAQVFQNLIANALKFRREGVPPRVHVSVEREGDTWIFCVADNGIGIDPRQADRLFQIFQRLHTREEYPGTGIGLALCKRIVERHGGRIWVESEPGEGSAFCFILPT